ncbi:MAG: hypothetical protein WAO91_10500 [Candidatus Nitrosotenuis sp.]
MTKEAETTKDEKFWESYKTHVAWLAKTPRKEDDKYWERYEERLFPASIESKFDGMIGIWRRISVTEYVAPKWMTHLEKSERKRMMTIRPWSRSSLF